MGDPSIPGPLSPMPYGRARDQANQVIHTMYTRHDFAACLREIDRQFHESNGVSEYPLYIKGLIRRQQGAIQESLELFQAATALNPHNIANLKQVGRSLYLLSKHKAAFDVYEEAQLVMKDDWEIYHQKGLCCVHLKQLDKAIFCFRKANELQPHDSTYMQLGKVRARARASTPRPPSPPRRRR